MQRIRIRGLVKLASNARHQLAHPITPEQLEQLRHRVRDGLDTVDEMLAEHSQNVNALPAPSRNAYGYLSRLDFNSAKATEDAEAGRYLPASLRFTGLRSFLNNLLDDLARLHDSNELDQLYVSIRETSEGLEAHTEANGILPEHLKPESRELRAWFAYFSDRGHFDGYVAAQRIAKPLMNKAAQGSRRFTAPVLVQFRPMNNLYRVRGFDDGTRFHLPTPMICFEASDFARLAETVFGIHDHKHAIVARTRSEPYRTIREAIERYAGEVEQSAGVFHDLAESFVRVNDTYFQGQMPLPRLVWNRQITGRKFGHYDLTHDTLMVSCTLDAPEVPVYVVDFLVYHELLHKKHGAQWRNGRQAFHTPEFRRDEKCFKHYAEAEAVLSKLAKQF